MNKPYQPRRTVMDKNEYLNPWIIEWIPNGRTEGKLHIVNRNTGEIRQVHMNVQKINNIWEESEYTNLPDKEDSDD